jgi:hypothetical protein
LRAHFDTFGKVIEIIFGKSKESEDDCFNAAFTFGVSPICPDPLLYAGYAFVQYADEAAANACMADVRANGIAGRRSTCALAVPKDAFVQSNITDGRASDSTAHLRIFSFSSQ